MEEPSISESEEAEHESSESSYLSQTKEEKLAANLADSDDENEMPFNRKDYKPTHTMTMIEDLVQTRADQNIIVPKIEAPELKR